MLSDEECREIWQTSLARCHPMNDISVAGILTAKAAFALGIERARNAPDAATRAVIERLSDVAAFLLDTVEKVADGPVSFPPSIADPRAAIAEARKLLEGDALAQPADDDAWTAQVFANLCDLVQAIAPKDIRDFIKDPDAKARCREVLLTSLRTRPSRAGFVSVPVEMLAEAYGTLWHINADAGAPPELEVPSLSAETGARAVRKFLLSVLTREQCALGIELARQTLAAATKGDGK